MSNKIYVVGFGPGAYEQMTIEAVNVLKEVDVITGYTVYTDIIKEYFSDKEYINTPMRQEVDRCKLTLDIAKGGKSVALVCSGDAGVYGLAGLMYEIAGDEDVEIEVIAGVSAVLSGASILGAPLIHDFTVISLSDLLTPWEKIETRLECAAKGDFVICLYNPSSKKRSDYLSKACNILMKYKDKNTVCGLVENIGREGQRQEVLSLEELGKTSVNMFTTVFIGNSQTMELGKKMVTPRGYRYE